jgi:hypothetical protein
MRWFRKNIRHGSWLTLLALAINFTLAFGHVHAVDARGSERVLVAAVAMPDSGQGGNHPADQHADYLCPICMAATALASPLTSPPPALPVQFANAAIDRAIVPDRAIIEPPRSAFQSRGPPIS